MRGWLIGILASVFATLGVSGSASASATIDLYWANSDNATFTSVDISSTVTLNVVLRAEDETLRRAGVTLDYSDAKSSVAVVGIANNPTMPSSSAMLPLVLGNTIDTGSKVQNLTAEVFPPFVRTGLVAGRSWLLGTVTFVTTRGGQFSLLSEFSGADTVLAASGDALSEIIFNSATLQINSVPEPRTVVLVGLGLLGLATLGRRTG